MEYQVKRFSDRYPDTLYEEAIVWMNEQAAEGWRLHTFQEVAETIDTHAAVVVVMERKKPVVLHTILAQAVTEACADVTEGEGHAG